MAITTVRSNLEAIGSALKPLRGALPLLIGGIFIAIVLAASEGQHSSLTGSLLDANKWTIQKYSIVKDVTLFAILIVGNIVTILFSAFIYFWDIQDSQSICRLRLARSSRYVTLAFLLNISIIIVIFSWLMLFCAVIYLEKPILTFADAGKGAAYIAYYLLISNIFAFSVFILFAAEDELLRRAMSQCEVAQGQADLKSGASTLANERKKVGVARRFSRDSFLFIDCPAILATICIFLGSLYAAGLAQVANGVTPYGYELFLHDVLVTRNLLKNLTFAQIKGLREEVSAAVVLGVAAGGHVMQLFLSQIIFLLLHIRRSAEER